MIDVDESAQLLELVLALLADAALVVAEPVAERVAVDVDGLVVLEALLDERADAPQQRAAG